MMQVTNLSVSLTEKRGDKHWNSDPKAPIRQDRYFSGTVDINGTTLPIKLHLMNSDGSIKENIDKWYVTCDINEPEEKFDDKLNHLYVDCNYCHKGDSTPGTVRSKSDTAQEVAKIVMPWLESQGYKMAKWDFVPGGWWLFDCWAKVAGKVETSTKGTWFIWKTPAICPVHGQIVHQYRERDCD